jgi:DNA-binding NarL/FixJ family response regulator
MSQQEAPAAEVSVRVLVVDDQQLIRDGIASLLAIQPGLVVVGTAANGQEAVGKVEALRPDVVLMDVRMPILDGIAATRAILKAHPEVQVLMLTTFGDEASVVEALQAGAAGYLLKDLPDHDLAQAIHAAHRRIVQLDPAVGRTLIEALRIRSEPSAPTTPTPARQSSGVKASEELSEREREVVRELARGASNKEIARTLLISEGTVKSHISNILSRLGLRDRTQVALYARDHGLLDGE